MKMTAEAATSANAEMAAYVLSQYGHAWESEDDLLAMAGSARLHPAVRRAARELLHYLADGYTYISFGEIVLEDHPPC